MKTLQMILITLTALSGCANSGMVAPANNNNTTVKTMVDSLTYLALGDSYTIGQSVSQSESFPYQLTSMLVKANYPVKQPQIIATTGWTTDDLISAIPGGTNNGSNTYDIVTLLIGVNDQYQGLSQDNYTIKFEQVLQTAIKLAKGDTSRVFVLSIPDYGVTPYANGQDSIIGPQIDQFNSINKAESARANVHYVDITPISRQAATDPTLIAPDGLHPSGKMYGLWMNLLEPFVAARLKKN